MKKTVSMMIVVILCFSMFSILAPRVKAQSNWIKYANNPVLDLGSSESWDDLSVWDPSVLYDGATYKMYYDGTPSSGQYIKIGLATSADGITWTKHVGNPILSTGPPGSWDNLQVSDPCVLSNGSMYLMYYSGNDGGTMRIGLATSPDGIIWTKYAGNPLFSATTWEGWWVTGPSVLFDGSTYKMWYTGYDGTHPGYGYQRIGYASSTDGITWTKHGTPVLDIGGTGEWDSLYVSHCSVIYDGSSYQMWYGGGNSTGPEHSRIGHATSLDGISWQKDPNNPVVDLGSDGAFDDWATNQPTVISVGSTLEMWYSGHDGTNTQSSPTYYARIGLATLEEISRALPAEVDLDPNALNLKSKGKWITAYVELPEGYDAASINVTSIALNGTIPAELTPTAIGDYDGDGVPDLMVKFSRSTVSELVLSEGVKYGNVTLTLTGKLDDGTLFEGCDIIRVRMPGDLNMDGKVDVIDIAVASSAFGSYPGHPRWNPIADEDDDNRVDILDVAAVCSNYGKTYT